jgi:hypothetical protein
VKKSPTFVTQPTICQNQYTTGTMEKSSPKIFKTLPKVKNRSVGENSPNLVPLMGCPEAGSLKKLVEA